MKKIGLLIPTTNLTVEYELQQMINEKQFKNVIFYTNRIPYKTGYKENKQQFLKEIAENSKAKLEELEYLNLDYYAFFCTSSSVLNKEKVGIDNPSNSLIEVIKYMNINKCLLITPYDNTIGLKIRELLVDNNVEVKKEIHLNLLNTADYFDYGINKLKELIVSEYKHDYENIVISCTNLPTIHLVDLEKILNTTVISSNLSMFWKINKENNLSAKEISKIFKEVRC